MTALTLVLTVVLAVGVGVSLGLLGGGGSILAVPLLVYVAGLPYNRGATCDLDSIVGRLLETGPQPERRP